MGKRTWWLVGVAAVLALGGCTSSNGAAPSSVAFRPTSSATPSVVDPSPETSALPPSKPTPSVIDPTELASIRSSEQASSGGLSLAPMPAGLTAEQTADANAAVEAYRRYWALFDASGAEPARDWSTQIAEVTAGTASDDFVNGTASLARDDLRATGTTTVVVNVTGVDPGAVYLTSCVDTSGTDLIDSAGTSFLAPDQPGSYRRYVSNAQIGLFDGGEWKVAVEQGDRNTTC